MAKAWYKKAIDESGAKDLGGWRKELPEDKRIAEAISSRPKNWNRHTKYLSAARALQALANVTKDESTAKAAKSDADYLFEKAKKYEYGGMSYGKGGKIEWDKDFSTSEEEGMEGWTYYYGTYYDNNKAFPFTYISMITDVGGQDTYSSEITWIDDVPPNSEKIERMIELDFDEDKFSKGGMSYAGGGQIRYTIKGGGDVLVNNGTAQDVVDWFNRTFAYEILDEEQGEKTVNDINEIVEEINKAGEYEITRSLQTGGILNKIKGYFDLSVLTERFTLKDIFSGKKI